MKWQRHVKGGVKRALTLVVGSQGPYPDIAKTDGIVVILEHDGTDYGVGGINGRVLVPGRSQSFRAMMQ